MPVHFWGVSLEQGPIGIQDVRTYEVASVHRVISHDGGIQSDIRLGQGVSDQVILAPQAVVDFGQGLVKRMEVLLVCLLCGRKSALVD